MAVYVNTNVSSLNGRRYLNNVQNQLTTTYQRLSSGMRINSAKDDAAGLQIADRLTTQINGLNQGNRNANDGIALAQTIESGMDEISGMLQKIRTLAVQSSNGTNTTEDRMALNKEAESLREEITRIAKQTKFGGQTVLAGKVAGSIYGGGDTAGGQLILQVGANNGDKISFDVANFTFSSIIALASVAASAAEADDIKLSAASHAMEVISAMDAMISVVDAQRADLGAIQNYTHANHSNIKQYNLVYLF